MVQQLLKRSYFYFLSFAKGQKKRQGITRGVTRAPLQRGRGSLISRARNSTKCSRPRPPWDNTIHDLSVWKLSAAELEVKRKAYKSGFRNCSANSTTISTGQSSSIPSLEIDDRSGLVSHEASATSSVGLAQAAVSSKTNLTSPHIKSGDSLKLEAESLHQEPRQELFVSRASKGCRTEKALTSISAISRVGKENSILKYCLPRASKTLDNAKRRSTPGGFTTSLILSGREIKDSSPSAVSSSTARSSRNQKTSTCSPATTVDFEDEVKQFEAEKKQRLENYLCSVTRSGRKTTSGSPGIVVVGEKVWKRVGKLDGGLLFDLNLPSKVMEKSSPTRYTHQPPFRVGMIDSSDDSVSGPLEGLRWQKGTQFVAKHRRHHSQKTPEVEGRYPTEKAQSYSWDPQPQKTELGNFKGEPNVSDTKIQTSRSGRTKGANIHVGNVQKTSPIMESWNGDLGGDSDDQSSYQQKDTHQYLVKCHREVMKEFKDLKLSISRQIVNLQLDIDKILANQKAAQSKALQGLLSQYPGSAAEGNIPDIVDENHELPAYSSLKFRQELIKPASPSSGESYHLPPSKLGSKYSAGQTGAHFDSWSQEESHRPTTSHKSHTAPTPSHVFRNLQNNPIYHVHTSSDKRRGGSDSDTSISSMGLAELKYQETMDSLMETKPESDARQSSSAEELDTIGTNSRVPRSDSLQGLQSKKSNGNSNAEPMGVYDELPEIGRTATSAAIQSHDVSYRDSKHDNNGHSRSHHVRSERREERNRPSKSDVSVAHSLQQGPSKTPRKDAVGVSNLSGTYTGKGTVGHDNLGVHPDNEPRSGTPGRSSPHPSEKKSRSASRPLFSEEAGKSTWDDLSTTSPTSNHTRESLHQHPHKRKEGPEQGRFTYSREEPQDRQYEKAASEERHAYYTREESQGQHYDLEGGDQARHAQSTEDPQRKQYGKVEAQLHQSIYTREELQNQPYGKAGIEQGTHAQARELQTRQYAKPTAEQARIRSPNSMIEKQGDGDPFTLRGWAAAFLDPPTDVMIKTQENTLQSASPKTDRHSSGRDSPLEHSGVQESPTMERHKEKENGNHYGHQYAVRQFAGKSSRGGCAWTVSEPSSPKNVQKGSPANGTPNSKARQKHHYAANNH